MGAAQRGQALRRRAVRRPDPIVSPCGNHYECYHRPVAAPWLVRPRLGEGFFQRRAGATTWLSKHRLLKS